MAFQVLETLWWAAPFLRPYVYFIDLVLLFDVLFLIAGRRQCEN